MRNKFIIISALLIFTFCQVYAQELVKTQSKIDSLQAILKKDINLESQLRTRDRLANELVKVDPPSALVVARENLKKCQDHNDIELHGEAMITMSQMYFRNQMIDSMKYSYETALPFYKKHQLHRLEGVALRSLAVVAQISGKLDSTLYYVDLCVQHLKAYPDSLTLGSAYFTQGSVFALKGFYNLSTEAYLKSLRCYKAVNNNQYIGYVEQGLGHTFLKIGRSEEAMNHNEDALTIFKEQENLAQVAQVLNNMGILYNRMGQYEKSRNAFHESIALSTQMNQSAVLTSIYHNLMDLEYSAGNFSLSLMWAEKTDSLASLNGVEGSRGQALRVKAFLAIERNDIATAKQLIQEALPYQKEYDDPEYSVESYKDMAHLYQQVGQHDMAYASLQQSKVFEESIFTIEKNTQIEELSLIYETEKKDAAIQLLEKEATVDRLQKSLLGGGLGLTLAIFGLGFYGIRQKLKRNQLRHQNTLKEKELETEKRKNAETELEFKKKELTAKALQLAKKNEFLQELEAEVTELQSSVDSTVGKASSRISRMIQRDTVNDEEWDQFSTEFTSVHQGFLDRLRERFGAFSKGEMRLIYLLRMNMNSKEIASLLHVSGDGVRKSRYRLRKKMGLEPSEDLQGLILGM